MQCIMLKAKLHQARATHAELEYEGSCAIDGDLLDASGIREYEQIDIYNIENGARLTTYAIRGEAGSGMISVNGAAAHHAEPGHRLIICAYASLSEAELDAHKPTVLYLDADNNVRDSANAIPVQVA